MCIRDSSLQEFAVLRVHQETSNLRAELDVTRVERDGARDQLGRLELDNQRLTRESKRALEHVAQSDKESEAERSALESRCQRLARELEDAMVKVEVLSAKGAMYDEVAATVDRLGRRAAEAEKELAAAKGAEESLRRERDAAASKLATREHQVELLSQDKAYLSREVDAAQDRERKHEEEEDRLREKVRALRTARDALQEKVMSGHAEVRSQHEERLAEEVRKDVLRFEAALNKDLRVIEREIQIDKELIERDVERVPITLEDFLRKEPPVLVGMLAIAVVNGAVGLFWALFFRETSAGPGGEFGKGVAALRKEVVKGILKFFGSIMGSYTQQDNRSR